MAYVGLNLEGVNMSELWRKGAVELAAMIRDREVSSREVVQAHLDRVETVNPHCPATFATFYLDPTHVKPVPAPLLAYMTEQSGLKVQALRFSSRFDTQESSPLDVSSAGLPDEVTHYLDYAVIARRQ